MLEEYQDLEMHVLLDNDQMSRRIIHRLQSGQNIDASLIGEYRFLERYFDSWSSFFSFLGYRLERSSQGGEIFYFLQPTSSWVKVAALRRGATFLGLFLAGHFMSSGIEGKDEVAARELISRLENSFEFNQLVRVFNPQQKNALRKRQQSSKQVEQLRGWVAKHLRELHRLRFVQLSPSINADLDRLSIFRMPGLSRFLEPARRSLDLEYDGHSDLDQAIRSIWSSIDWDEDNAAEDTEPEDT